MTNLEQSLIETIADWLDSEPVVFEQNIMGLIDPLAREASDLHIKMALAAMECYKQHMKPAIKADKTTHLE